MEFLVLTVAVDVPLVVTTQLSYKLFKLIYIPISNVRASLVAQWKRIHLQYRTRALDPRVEKIPWSRKWQPTPVFLPGKSHGHRSLVGYSPWGHKRAGHDSETKQQQEAMCKSSRGSISSTTLGISSFYNFSHSNEYQLLFYCGFHLHFPDD